MESKNRKRYTEDFKAQAIELMHTGKPVVELAEEFCVSTALLYRWRRGTHEIPRDRLSVTHQVTL
jgi:transposase-like protein